MNHTAVSRGDTDVRDAPVVAIGKEQEIARGVIGGYVVRNPHRVVRLLPRVSPQWYTVQRKDPLHEAGAVYAPWRHASPQVAGTGEQGERAPHDRVAVAWELCSTGGGIDGHAFNHLEPERHACTERQGAAPRSKKNCTVRASAM